MRIRCPSCDATLSAPESVAGKRVKCPKCSEAFVAKDDEAAEREAVQPGEPARPSRAPRLTEDEEDAPRPSRRRDREGPEERDEDDRPRRRDEDEADDRDDRDERKSGRSAALRGAALPGYALWAAAGFNVLAAVVWVVMSYLTTMPAPMPPPGVGGPPEAFRFGHTAGQMCFSCCGAFLYLVAVVFISVAALNLGRLKLMGMVITGVVVAVVAAGLQVVSAVGYVLMMMANHPGFGQTGKWPGVVVIAVNALAVLLNVAAAGWACVMLFRSDVRRYFR